MAEAKSDYADPERQHPRPVPGDFIVQTGFEVIVDSNTAFAVPRGAPDELVRCLLAAHRAYHFGFKSIDYLMRRYAEGLGVRSNEHEVDSLIREGTSKIRANALGIAQEWRMGTSLPDRFGLVVAGGALLRVESSFKAACVLCETAMGFEAFCLAKLILEQIGWALAIHEIEGDSVYKMKPSACINSLRVMYPRVGKFYGYLNMQAHIDPKTIHEFLKPRKTGMGILLRTSDKCIEACVSLLRLADMYGACMEAVFRPWYTEFKFIRKGTPEVQLKARRKSQTEVTDYAKRAFKYLERTHRGTQGEK